MHRLYAHRRTSGRINRALWGPGNSSSYHPKPDGISSSVYRITLCNSVSSTDLPRRDTMPFSTGNAFHCTLWSDLPPVRIVDANLALALSVLAIFSLAPPIKAFNPWYSVIQRDHYYRKCSSFNRWPYIAQLPGMRIEWRNRWQLKTISATKRFLIRWLPPWSNMLWFIH